MAKPDSDRTRRIAELIQTTLANLLQVAADQRFQMVTIISVSVTRDLSFARIYVTLLNENEAKKTIVALNKAAAYFRYHLAQAIELRVMPTLKFFYDDSVVRGSYISSLISQATKNLPDE